MKKTIAFLSLVINLLSFSYLYADSVSYQVKKRDIAKGYITEKIWLNELVMPKVEISDLNFSPAQLPADAKQGDPTQLKLAIGMERKRAFVLVHIPVYSSGTEPGTVNQLSSFTLTVTEQASTHAPEARKTDGVANSVLATGTWYKIGVTNTGLFKIDFSFLKSMGLNPANINPANIRVFGNGGNMLSEDNRIVRPTDLIENAVLVNANSDNVFDNGESVIFYAVGPTAWYKDSINQRFTHLNNLYTDTAYYFITFDNGAAPFRIATQPAMSAGNVNVTDFNYYDVHDLDLISPVGLGKLWYGEQFFAQLSNTSQNFVFNTGPTTSCAYTTVQFGGIGDATNTFSVSLNGNVVGSGNLSATAPTIADQDMSLGVVSGSGACGTTSSITVNVTFNPVDASGGGYLDYIELNVRRSLQMTGDQMNFRDWKSVAPGNIANYQVQNANSSTSVWDVTNPQVPVLMSGTLNGSTYTFTQDASKLHEFAVMNSLNLFTPVFSGQVANQNLHGMPQPDLIIVTYPGFLTQANQLAAYHFNHDAMTVDVATTDQVYNEFSSGGQDLSAIRDFAKMFYDRNDTKMPRYLLLLGGASYDYKNRLTNNSNFVPVFESAESTNDLDAFSTDDFYGFLDTNEYIEDNSRTNVLDIGVGRLPARSVDDANSMVNKIISYTQPATLGPWRIASVFTACIVDGAGDHMGDAETMAETVTGATQNLYNEDKVYENAIPTVPTPAGLRCPNANAELDNDVFKGVFLMNYNGHGNTEVWSSERILTADDYNNWNNANMLPFMVTATCDFGQFDHPQFVSSAEQLVIRSGGGVIAVLTTTEAVYAQYNIYINTQFLTSQFTRNADGTWNAFGDASRIGKNITYINCSDGEKIANFRKFSLLGDPALIPDFPQNNIRLDSTNDGVTMARTDSIKALGKYIIHGSVRDGSGNTMTGFNGSLYLTLYDKPSVVSTIVGTPRTFQLQNVIIYKGIVSVTNGIFQVEFITPKDINYFYGSGKISTYADNGTTDAAGVDTFISIGGYSSNPIISNNPPVVRPYINDSLFQNGGITGTNTSLYVLLYDETGINVSGNELGHNLTAVLDGNVESPYNLNDYYQTFANTYQYGYVSFPIYGIPDGKHTLTVKAWDVNDNSAEGSVDFMVIDSTVMVIQNLQNYPNPFSNTTNFVFEHNHPYEQLGVQLLIYNVTGQLVKEIDDTFVPTDSRTSEISWDGTDKNGARLPSGMYVYRLNINTAEGFKSSAYQKLVIVR